MTKLKISPQLSLPEDAVTETIAILAKRGAGKSYTASVLAEEMLEAHLQVVVLDPMGAWYGLRTSADGKSAGYEIAILGGDHGDIPLEATGGVVAADLVVDERLSVILDIGLFSKTDRRRFATDFLERFYQRNREPLHLFIEEADMFAPQSSGRGDENARMLGAMYDIVRRGRGRGIGSTLITQRSASISKEVLEQAELLIALRTTGPRDRKAVEGWISVHGEEEARDEVLASLPSMPTGTAWVWWPVEGILKQVKVRARRTFDSSATPKVGEKRRAPKTVADVDLSALQERMAETIERAKASDPAELNRKIRDLQKRLSAAEAAGKATADPLIQEVEVLVPVMTEDDRTLLKELAMEIRTVRESFSDFDRTVLGSLDERLAELRLTQEDPPMRIPTKASPAKRSTTPREQHGRHVRRPSGTETAVRARPPAQEEGEGPPLTKGRGERTAAGRILDALATLEEVALPEVKKGQLALFAEASPTSSAYTNNLGALRTAGWIDYPRGGFVCLTAEGRHLAVTGAGPATTDELHQFIFDLVKPARARILEVLISEYPGALEKDVLADKAGASPTSSAYGNNLGSLRSLGFIEYPSPGFVVATTILFLEGS